MTFSHIISFNPLSNPLINTIIVAIFSWNYHSLWYNLLIITGKLIDLQAGFIHFIHRIVFTQIKFLKICSLCRKFSKLVPQFVRASHFQIGMTFITYLMKVSFKPVTHFIITKMKNKRYFKMFNYCVFPKNF